MANIKWLIIPSADKDEKQSELSYTNGDGINCTTILENHSVVNTIKHMNFLWLSNSTLDIYVTISMYKTEDRQDALYEPMWIAALFVTQPETGNNPNVPNR